MYTYTPQAYAHDHYNFIKTLYSPTPVSLTDQLQRLFSHLKQTSPASISDVNLMGQCLVTMVAICSPSDLITHIPYDDIIDLLRYCTYLYCFSYGSHCCLQCVEIFLPTTVSLVEYCPINNILWV